MKISIKNLDPDQSKKLLQIIWQVLDETNHDRQNEPELCGTTLDVVVAGYTPYGEEGKRAYNRAIHRIIRKAYASGLSFSSDALKRLIFIGNGNCPGCGSNDIDYSDDFATCECCGHNWPVTVNSYSW